VDELGDIKCLALVDLVVKEDTAEKPRTSDIAEYVERSRERVEEALIFIIIFLGNSKNI